MTRNAYAISYLRSPRWRMIRWWRLRRDRRRCRTCGSRARLEVHHSSYVNRGAPGLRGMFAEARDCVTLCAKCHGKIHGEKNRKRGEL